jgi:hypothetical protein
MPLFSRRIKIEKTPQQNKWDFYKGLKDILDHHELVELDTYMYETHGYSIYPYPVVRIAPTIYGDCTPIKDEVTTKTK